MWKLFMFLKVTCSSQNSKAPFSHVQIAMAVTCNHCQRLVHIHTFTSYIIYIYIYISLKCGNLVYRLPLYERVWLCQTKTRYAWKWLPAASVHTLVHNTQHRAIAIFVNEKDNYVQELYK